MANGNAGRSIVGGINGEGTRDGVGNRLRSVRYPGTSESLASYAVGTEFRTVEKGLYGERERERKRENER